jgi:hypothetical protein
MPAAVVAIVGVLFLAVAALVALSSPAVTADPQQAWIDYRAGERAAQQALEQSFTQDETQRAFNDYRAGERAVSR